MKLLQHISIIVLLLIFSLELMGQGKKEVNKPKVVLNQYLNFSTQDSSLGIINKQWLDNLPGLLDSTLLIFDVPIKNRAEKQDKIQDLSKEDRQPNLYIPVFQKIVAVDQYQEMLMEYFSQNKTESIQYNLSISKGPVEYPIAESSQYQRIVGYEITKVFSENDTLSILASTHKYIVKLGLRKTKSDFKIIGIEKNDESLAKSNVNFVINLHGKRERILDLYMKFDIVSDEKINSFKIDTIIPDSFISNVEGTITKTNLALGQMAKRDTIKVKFAYDSVNHIKYKIPDIWQYNGRSVNDIPPNGFDLSLNPILWNGWSYTVALSGGITGNGAVDSQNFQDPNSFKSNDGYKVGAGFRVTKYFWPNNLNKHKPLLGIGTGISLNYQSSSTTSNGFTQNLYEYNDPSGYPSEIQFKSDGSSFIETDIVGSLALPLYLEFLWKFSRKVALSVDFGVSTSFPAYAQYKASGTFSRWGYLEGYVKPITDDPVYNYFTDQDTTYKGNIEYTWYIVDMVGSLNFYFDIFGENSANSLKVGFFFSSPLTESQNFDFDRDSNQGLPEYSPGYWISTENDQYNSVAYGKKNINDYYIGMTIGINFVKFRTSN